jgi:hypothetical protein
VTVSTPRRTMSHKIKEQLKGIVKIPLFFFCHIFCGNYFIIDYSELEGVVGMLLTTGPQSFIIRHLRTELHIIFCSAFNSGYKYKLQYSCLFCGN